MNTTKGTYPSQHKKAVLARTSILFTTIKVYFLIFTLCIKYYWKKVEYIPNNQNLESRHEVLEISPFMAGEQQVWVILKWRYQENQIRSMKDEICFTLQ